MAQVIYTLAGMLPVVGFLVYWALSKESDCPGGGGCVCRAVEWHGPCPREEQS